jgi:hypothetical protein
MKAAFVLIAKNGYVRGQSPGNAKEPFILSENKRPFAMYAVGGYFSGSFGISRKTGCDGGGSPPAAFHPDWNDMRTISKRAFCASSYSLRSMKSEKAFSNVLDSTALTPQF